MVNTQKLGQKHRDTIRNTDISNLTNEEKIKLFLQYGTLAPSTHNTQPWKFSIQGDILKVFADFSKKIPIADPTGRDMYISIGALIKNIELSSKEYGVKASIELIDKSKNDELVAEIRFSNLNNAKNSEKSMVINGIIKRQNYRGFFEDLPDKANFNEILNSVISRRSIVGATVADKKDVIEELAQLTVKGLKKAYATKEFRKEIGSLINHNLSRKKYGLHGYSLRMNTPQSLIVPKIVKRKDIGTKLGALNYKSFVTSPVVIVLTSQNDDRKSWLAIGQVMEEFMVRASAADMATSIYTAAIEMPGMRGEVSKVLKLNKNNKPQILFCVGYPSAPLPYSVRKNISKMLR